jgi:hypothetical protein
MKKLFSALFGNPAPDQAKQPPFPCEPVERSLDHYLARAMRRSGALTPRGEAVVSAYLAEFGNPMSEELDAAQVRAKGGADASLNLRFAELLRAPLSPRRPLTTFAGELHRDALLQKARYDAVVQMRAFCAEMVLTIVGTGDECAWCCANRGKRFSVLEDPNELLARHCHCAPYASATFHPAINDINAINAINA